MGNKCKIPTADPYKGNNNGPTQAFIDQLCKDLNSATEGRKKSTKTIYETSLGNTQSRLCLLTKAEKNQSVYRILDNCVVTATARGAELVKTGVGALIQTETEMKKQFDDLLKALKEGNKKLGEVEIAANYLQDAYEDPPNTDNQQALNRSIQGIKGRIDDIAKKADECNDRIDDTLEEAVVTIGKQTYLNLSGLNEFVGRVTNSMKFFADDVAANSKMSADHITDTQKNLTEAIKLQVASQVGFFDAAIEVDGLGKVIKFICNPEQPKDSLNCQPDDLPKTPQTPQTNTPAQVADGVVEHKLRCCKDLQPVDPNQPVDCIDEWAKLAQAKGSEFADNEAIWKQYEAEFKNANVWEQRLKQYWEAIQKTNVLAHEVSAQIKLFMAQSNEVCQTAKWLTASAKHLTGLLWETHYNTKILQTQVTELVNAIRCASDTTLRSGNIWQAIADLETKLNAAILLLEVAIKSMLIALKTAIIMQSSICRNDKEYSRPEDTGENGLRGKLDELGKYFDWREDDSDRLKLTCKPCGNLNYCTVRMPLDKDVYYNDTKDQYEASYKVLAGIKESLDTAQKVKDKLLAEKTGLDNAIKAAREARKN